MEGDGIRGDGLRHAVYIRMQGWEKLRIAVK